MKNAAITSYFLVIATCFFFILCQMENILADSSNGNVGLSRNRANGVLKYPYRVVQYRRLKPHAIMNDFEEDDDDVFNLSKRQQTNSDDYGHLRFGKREEQVDDYGHMRFGRNDGERK
uniref:Sulfakinin n=1 Tax=Dendroctonus armandi TaxID=77159 RepID=A0A8F7GP30_9CUCU|nr:sulfakinin [Dendroctonus armandi]